MSVGEDHIRLAEALANLEEHKRRLRERDNELAAEREKVRRLRREVRLAQVAAEKRNRQLDALGHVWCSGGCSGGMGRFNDDETSGEMVAYLVANAARAQAWWINRRLKEPGGSQEVSRTSREKLDELVGKAAAIKINQLAYEVEYLASRVATVAAARGELLEENARLKRELDAERIELSAVRAENFKLGHTNVCLSIRANNLKERLDTARAALADPEDR